MSAFNRLPGFTRSPPGLEHCIWRRLPSITAWGTLLPLCLVALNHLLVPELAADGALDAARLQRDFLLYGLIALHWTLVLTVGLGCFIVRVMKGPAYVADAYPMPTDPTSPER
jgi:hypothetical protein